MSKFWCYVRCVWCAWFGHFGPRVFTAGHWFCERCMSDMEKNIYRGVS